MRNLLGITFRVVGAVSVPLTFLDLIAYPTCVRGTSMEPTLLHGDFVWVSRFFAGTPSVGDIYCFTSPFDPTKTHIKRVTALEGQITTDKKGEEVTVSKNHLWVISDNVSSPSVLDSRHYGEVNYGLLQGKAVCIIWPPNRWKSLAVSNKLTEIQMRKE